jgi:hypothetical protein
MKFKNLILLACFMYSSIGAVKRERLNIFVDKELERSVLEFKKASDPKKLKRTDFVSYLKTKGYINTEKSTSIHFWASFRGTGFEILKKFIKK